MSFPSPEDRAREAVDSIRFHKAGVLSLGEIEGDGLSIPEIVRRISIAEEAQAMLNNAAGNNPDSTVEPLKLNLAHLAFFLYGNEDRFETVMFDAHYLDKCLRSLEPFLKMSK